MVTEIGVLPERVKRVHLIDPNRADGWGGEVVDHQHSHLLQIQILPHIPVCRREMVALEVLAPLEEKPFEANSNRGGMQKAAD